MPETIRWWSQEIEAHAATLWTYNRKHNIRKPTFSQVHLIHEVFSPSNTECT